MTEAIIPDEVVESIDLRGALQEFLEANTDAQLDDEVSPSRVLKPWNDDTFFLKVTAEDEFLIQTLNAVVLPPRFSAIYHKDTRRFEFVFGILRKDHALPGRAFTYRLAGLEEIVCEWAQSSDRLIALSNCVVSVGTPGTTQWRNLQNYTMPEEDADLIQLSFWVGNVDCDETAFAQIARHLNFLMAYYDSFTPLIIIHEGALLDDVGRKPQFPRGDFPAKLQSKRLDPYLLGLWETAALQQDVFLKYLYNYQILEYAALSFMKMEVAAKVRRVLEEPNVSDNPQASMRRVLAILDSQRGSDDERFRDLVTEHVESELVWQAVEPNVGLFTQEMAFDGGFRLPALLKSGTSHADFVKCYSGLPDKLRKLRNALVHSRDYDGGILIPSKGNYHKVRVWLEPLKVIASEIVLHSISEDSEE